MQLIDRAVSVALVRTGELTSAGLVSSRSRVDLDSVDAVESMTVTAHRVGTSGHQARLGGAVREVPAALVAPFRPLGRPVAVLVVVVVLAETVGLLTRLGCRTVSCAPWTARFDLDALGSVPRLLVTSLLAVTALSCGWAVRRAGRHGAAVWWAVLGLGTGMLAVAKHTSLHSVLESRLPGVDAQLLFVVVTVVGLTAVTVSGRWVRRGTRTVVVTWLGLYALASVGLGALSVLLGQVSQLAGDLSSYVEEAGEGLAAVGLLIVVAAQAREVSRRA